MLALSRKVAPAFASLKAGKWDRNKYMGTQLADKTLGIIGCGRIGQAVARRANGFGMKLLAYDPAPSPAAEKLGVRFVSLADLLAQSDFVSLHAALTPQTRGLIGAA